MSKVDVDSKTSNMSGDTVSMSFKDWKMKKESMDKNSTSDKKKPKRQSNQNKSFNSTNVNPLPPPLLSLGVCNQNGNQFYGNGGFRNGGGINNMNNFNNGDGMNNMNNFNNGWFNNGYRNNFGFRNNGFNNFDNGDFECNMRSMDMFNNNAFNQNIRCNNNGFRKDMDFGFMDNNSNVGGNRNFSDNFFKSDSFFDQKDMMKKTIDENPFRNNTRAKQLLDELKNSSKKTPPEKRNAAQKTNLERRDVKLNPSKNNTLPKTQPVPNIRKPFVPKPSVEISGSIEERKRDWKEYRDAMKPFKNREFYNAKRVVQRLGKKDPSELDEKDKFRLQNAQERIAAYKQRLAEKYDHYVPSPSKPDEEKGQLYILKKGNQSDWPAKKVNIDQYKNYGNFGEIPRGDYSSTGRKILGAGTNKYPGFVSGGTMNSISQF
ncbi:uncharacterized protein LOC142227305 [Haematobia irritans]|uniref:uncharacterized protein LOC142227305 n=1 Tax=Haematobia irritans TaxID=7368 RepID=UPI003F4FB602